MSKRLTREEEDRLFATREKIDRISKLSRTIERLDRIKECDGVSHQEGVRNVLQAAVFCMDDQDVIAIIEFVVAKATAVKEKMEQEVAGLRVDVGLDADSN